MAQKKLLPWQLREHKRTLNHASHYDLALLPSRIRYSFMAPFRPNISPTGNILDPDPRENHKAPKRTKRNPTAAGIGVHKKVAEVILVRRYVPLKSCHHTICEAEVCRI